MELVKNFETYVKNKFLFDDIKVFDLDIVDMDSIIPELEVYGFLNPSTTGLNSKSFMTSLKYRHNKPKVLVLSRNYQSTIHKAAIFIYELNDSIMIPMENIKKYSNLLNMGFILSEFTTFQSDGLDFSCFMQFKNDKLSFSISTLKSINPKDNLISSINSNRQLEILLTEEMDSLSESSFELTMLYNNVIIKSKENKEIDEELVNHLKTNVNANVKRLFSRFLYPYDLSSKELNQLEKPSEFTREFVDYMMGDGKNVLEMINV